MKFTAVALHAHIINTHFFAAHIIKIIIIDGFKSLIYYTGLQFLVKLVFCWSSVQMLPYVKLTTHSSINITTWHAVPSYSEFFGFPLG